jgi:hypothetical protein
MSYKSLQLPVSTVNLMKVDVPQTLQQTSHQLAQCKAENAEMVKVVVGNNVGTSLSPVFQNLCLSVRFATA